MNRHVFSFALLVLLTLESSCRAAERTDDQEPVVARVEGRAIRHSEIRCPRAMAQDARRCLEVENTQLHKILQRRLVDLAASRAGIVLTEKDVLAAIPPQLLDETVLRAAEKRWKLVASAVLEVRNGADADSVYKERLATNGIVRAEFDSALAMYSVEDARRTATADLVSETRQRVLNDYKEREQIARLRRAVEQTADEKNLSYEAAAAELWAAVIREAEVVVEDSRYSMPDLKGLL